MSTRKQPARMGRRRTKDLGLPKRVYIKGPSYYFVTRDNDWIRLCRISEGEAALHRALADLKADKPEPGMAIVIRRYRAEILANKAASTIKSQSGQLDTIEAAFGRMDPPAIRPHMIAQFHDLRGETAPVAANRELALLSHLMRFAIRIGAIPSGVNPCETIARHPEEPRDRYITDAEYNAVWLRARPHMRVIMDLAFLTGQRQGDIVRLKRSQLQPDGIHFAQSKGTKRLKRRGQMKETVKRKLVIAWSENLRSVVTAAFALTDVDIAQYVVCKPDGMPYTSSGVQSAWQLLQRAAFAEGLIEERFTFHDIRGKAGTDDADGRLLGHMDPRTLKKVYRRKAETFKPVY